MHNTRSRPSLRTGLLAAFLLLALPVTVLAWAFPRASRVAIYQNELANPSTLAAVAGVFTNEHPDAGQAPFLVDLGYAQLRLRDEPAGVAQIRPGIVEIKCDTGRIIAFAPFLWRGRNGVWDPIIGVVGAGDDPTLDPFVGMGDDFDLGHVFEGAAGFEWNASAVRTLPETLPVIWSMSDDAFGRLYLRTLFKAMESSNEAGGWVIHTPRADSIVRFGRPARPGRVHLAVWSPLGDLTQGMVIESESADWSRSTAHTIASSWTPMVDEAPKNPRELERLIARGLAGELRRTDNK
jgi:hypothetical protein